jgi:hypothetical protein
MTAIPSQHQSGDDDLKRSVRQLINCKKKVSRQSGFIKSSV